MTERFSVNDGIHGRDNRNGKYLDQIQQDEFAVFHAARDGGNPEDVENYQDPGNQYVDESDLRKKYNVTSLPFDDHKPVNEVTAPVIFGGAPTISGVTAGTPGAFAPPEAAPPANLSALKAHPVIGDSEFDGAAWESGEYVELGDESSAHWDGVEWIAGDGS